jgi:cytochrome b6-f complex iron-sulfur subunit
MRPLTRREFLYYVWGASIALLTAEITFVLRPRYGVGECFICYELAVNDLPPPDGQPHLVKNSKSRPEFWLVNVGPRTTADLRHPAGVSVQPGILALYPVCPHIGCFYEWGKAAEAFICACDGSTFLRDGTRIHGPATRDLDRFVVTIMNNNGRVLGQTRGDKGINGQPVALPEEASIIGVGLQFRFLGRSY